MSEELFDVGKIVNTHGIHGEIRVIRITDFEERFKPGGTLYLVRDNEQPRKLTTDSHRKHKQFDLLKFVGLNDINDVEHFKGAHLKVAKEDLTELPEGEYYYYELLGCEVFTIDGEKLGVIKEVLSPGANDVWVVKRTVGKDVLLPFIKDVVKDINIQDKKIVIELMEGLLD